MAEESSKPQFPPRFAEKVKCAIKLNRNETDNVYHHPTESRIVKKCLDLSCKKPLHAVGNIPQLPSEEKWLEAYLIHRAKRNNWVLELANKRFRFLYSQLNFRGTVSERPRPLDLLLYEQETHHLIVVELKVKRELGVAKKELGYYCEQVSSLKDEIAGVFDLGKVSGVRGYIVWPGNERADNNKHDFGPFGVIEYTKIDRPWIKYIELGEDLIINFDCVRESEEK